MLSEWLTFNLGLAVLAALPEDACPPKKPSGEDTVLLTVFFWGRGGGQLGPAEGASSLEVGRKEPGGNTWLSAGGGEWFGSDECLPSLPVCVSELRLSVDPAVKLTWMLRKGGLRLSVELLLALSSSALFGFIFRARL